MKKRILLIWVFSCFFLFYSNAIALSEKDAARIASEWIETKTDVSLSLSNLSSLSSQRVLSVQDYLLAEFYPQGWVLIRSDDVDFRVVGYSLENPFTVEKTSLSNDMQKSESYVKYRSRASGPLLGNIEWDDDKYYNEQCPMDSRGPGGHAYIGCIATAMGQVMKFHRHPVEGFGSHSYEDPINQNASGFDVSNSAYGIQSAAFNQTTYAWDIMPDSISSSNPEIAQLLYHAGVSVEMNFGPYGSSAMITNAESAMIDFFKYEFTLFHAEKKNYTDEEWKNLLKSELDAGRPIIYKGEGVGSHVFVCDGYDDSTPTMFHFNWGWGGSNNGYFLLSDLTPGSSDYSLDQEAIFGITPASVPNLSFPYSENFENISIPQEWLIRSDNVVVSANEAKEGMRSLFLNGPSPVPSGENVIRLKINIPMEGAALEFWVKRGYDTISSKNRQSCFLMPEFGSTPLHVFYEGNDFNDTVWRSFSQDLTPWSGEVVILHFDQAIGSLSRTQWAYIDEVSVTPQPSLQVNLEMAIRILKMLSGLPETISADNDINNDEKIGLEEVIYILRSLSQ